jgi:hypothetical protein
MRGCRYRYIGANLRGQPVPALFSDKAFKLSGGGGNFRISTSNTGRSAPSQTERLPSSRAGHPPAPSQHLRSLSGASRGWQAHAADGRLRADDRRRLRRLLLVPRRRARQHLCDRVALPPAGTARTRRRIASHRVTCAARVWQTSAAKLRDALEAALGEMRGVCLEAVAAKL